MNETLSAPLGPDSPRSRGLALLAMGPEGSTVHPLPERGTVVIGRADDCVVQIGNPKLSRRHAVFTAGDELTIADLGSLNGTFVRGERIAPHAPVPVSVGDAITIGSTVLVLQRKALAPRPRNVWSHGYFEARLEEECARATGGGAPFAVARLRLTPVPTSSFATGQVADAADVLGAWLREIDIVATYAPHEYEVLLAGATPEAAAARISQLSRRFLDEYIDAALAVAAFPRDGRTPGALIEHLSRVLDQSDTRGERAPDSTVAVGALERLDKLVRRVAAAVINVLVLGETGVGKDVLARRIHALSPRAKMPLVAINCAALNESLLESELFGHEKGAFTGAMTAKLGLLESASGGTVFLDEIGEMPIGLQAKLLRVLEQREVTRVGALRPRVLDVRFVAATNAGLEEQIARGRFRRDLYFRLNGVSLALPPLRERVDEIAPLARAFAEQVCRAAGRRPVRFSRAAMALLEQYAWPGNVRELRNMVERAVLLCSADVIAIEHLASEKMGPVLKGMPQGAPSVPPTRARAITSEDESSPAGLGRGALLSARGDAAGTAGDAGVVGGERHRVMAALEKCAGNQSHAARLLGVSRGTLIKRIRDFNLPRPRKRD